jgi:thermitase
MKLQWFLIALALLASRAFGQTADGGAFYWFGDQKIALKPAQGIVAAKVQASVDYLAKYPQIKNSFRKVGKSDLLGEPVLLSAASAAGAVMPAVKTQEAYFLPVFEAGKAKLILQSEIIIGFKEDKISAFEAEAFLQHFGKSQIARQPGVGLRYLVQVPDARQTLRWANVLHGNVNVLYAEPNFMVLQPAGAATTPIFVKEGNPIAAADASYPSDSLYSQQWALKKIGAPSAWITTHGSTDIRIAILDNGVDVEHADLKPKIVAAWDAIFESTTMDLPPDDTHGTSVAGIAAASTNNGLGIAGLAADVKLIAIRMMSNVDAVSESKSLVVITNAFSKAAELGADVINCSWTLATPSKSVENAIAAAASLGRNSKGIVVVFAAGNEGTDVDYPANLSSHYPILAVGASNEGDQLKMKQGDEPWWGSNIGPSLTILAPGIHIVTTTSNNATPSGSQPYVTNFNGTSAAAPHVAAAAALILSQNPSLTAVQVRDLIVATADNVGSTNTAPAISLKRVNVCRALGRSDCGLPGQP